MLRELDQALLGLSKEHEEFGSLWRGSLAESDSMSMKSGRTAKQQYADKVRKNRFLLALSCHPS